MKIFKRKKGNEEDQDNFLGKLRREPIVSPVKITLLVILIAIILGASLYAYLIIAGSSTKTDSRTSPSFIISNFCASVGGNCPEGSKLYVIIENSGGTAISGTGSAGAAFKLYFTDVSSTTSGSQSLAILGNLAPGNLITMKTNSFPAGMNVTAGDVLALQAVLSTTNASSSKVTTVIK